MPTHRPHRTPETCAHDRCANHCAGRGVTNRHAEGTGRRGYGLPLGPKSQHFSPLQSPPFCVVARPSNTAPGRSRSRRPADRLDGVGRIGRELCAGSASLHGPAPRVVSAVGIWAFPPDRSRRRDHCDHAGRFVPICTNAPQTDALTRIEREKTSAAVPPGMVAKRKGRAVAAREDRGDWCALVAEHGRHGAGAVGRSARADVPALGEHRGDFPQ